MNDDGFAWVVVESAHGIDTTVGVFTTIERAREAVSSFGRERLADFRIEGHAIDKPRSEPIPWEVALSREGEVLSADVFIGCNCGDDEAEYLKRSYIARDGESMGSSSSPSPPARPSRPPTGTATRCSPPATGATNSRPWSRSRPSLRKTPPAPRIGCGPPSSVAVRFIAPPTVSMSQDGPLTRSPSPSGPSVCHPEPAEGSEPARMTDRLNCWYRMILTRCPIRRTAGDRSPRAADVSTSST